MKYRWLLTVGVALPLISVGTPVMAGQARGAAAWGPEVSGPPGAAVPSGFQPQSVTFISQSYGWVLGAAQCGTARCLSLLRTVDGGRTWRSIPAPPATLTTISKTPGVYELRFADRNDGFAYGPRLYATHNGGASWSRIRLYGDVLDLAATSSVSYAMVLGADYSLRVYSSPVTGNHWSRVAALPVSGMLKFAGQYPVTLYRAAAWIFLGQWIYASQTGTTWVRERVPCPEGFPAMSLATYDQARVTLVCEQPSLGAAEKILYASRDGGRTFTRVSQPPFLGAGSNLARPASTLVFLACTSTRALANFIYVSRDGGRAWGTSLKLADGAKGWTAFGFVTAQQGAVVEGTPAIGSHLYLTRDSGHTWQRIRF